MPHQGWLCWLGAGQQSLAAGITALPKFVAAMVALEKSAPPSWAEEKLAPNPPPWPGAWITTPLNLAFCRIAPLKLTDCSVAFDSKLAPAMVALAKLVPLREVPSKTAPVRLPPEKSTEASCAFLKSALMKVANCTWAMPVGTPRLIV